jgi:GNAT superfamily N-acetyltransferase
VPAQPTPTVEPFASADALAPADLERAVEAFNAGWAEWSPGHRRVDGIALRDADRFTHPPEAMHRWLARGSDGALDGFAWVVWRDGEPGASGSRLFVHPDARRRGVGTALVRALASTAKQHDRTGMTLEVAVDGVADQACARAGLKEDMVVELNVTDPRQVSGELLDGWVAAGEAAEGYSIVGYEGRCPDELAEDFIHARHIMNDAPRWEGEPELSFTVSELRAAEDAAARSHLDWWNLGVRHDASGEMVGISDMYLPSARPWLVFQGDTGVAPAHRGHRLGAWMKAVNHLRLRYERPAVERVETWNAAANEPMLRINRALGFAPEQLFRGWLMSFD